MDPTGGHSLEQDLADVDALLNRARARRFSATQRKSQHVPPPVMVSPPKPMTPMRKSLAEPRVPQEIINQLAALQSEVAALESENSRLDAERDHLRDRLTHERDLAYADRISLAEHDAALKASSAQQIFDAYSEMRDKYNGVLKECSELSDKHTAANLEAEKLKLELQAAQRATSLANSSLTSTERSRNELSETAMRLKAQLADALRHQADLEERVDAAEAAAAADKERATAIQKEYLSTMESMKSRTNTTEAGLEAAKEAQALAEDRQVASARQAAAHCQRADEYEALNSKLQDQLAEVQEQLRAARAALKTEKAGRQAAVEEAEAAGRSVLHAARDELRAAKEAAQAAEAELAAHCEALEADLAARDQQIATLEDTVSSLRASLDQMQTEIESSQTAVQRSQNLRSELTSLLAEHEEAQTALAESEERTAALAERLKTFQTRHDTEVNALEDSISDLKTKQIATRTRCEHLSNTCNEATVLLEAVQTTLSASPSADPKSLDLVKKALAHVNTCVADDEETEEAHPPPLQASPAITKQRSHSDLRKIVADELAEAVARAFAAEADAAALRQRLEEFSKNAASESASASQSVEEADRRALEARTRAEELNNALVAARQQNEVVCSERDSLRVELGQERGRCHKQLRDAAELQRTEERLMLRALYHLGVAAMEGPGPRRAPVLVASTANTPTVHREAMKPAPKH